jgi:SAM-dependent methyltransferase/diadenosine tetraphosphate (Ap4A) HIT family hydrolase
VVDQCHACELVARRDAGMAPGWDAIVRTPGWDVAHAFDTSVEGWTVLVLRRHAASMAELTGQEAAELGPLLKAVSEGLAVATGCERTYVAQFAESPLHRHVHFHVVPRAADLAEDQRGPRIFARLGRPEDERVPEARMEQIAFALRRELTVRGIEVDSAASASTSSGGTPFIPLPEGLPDPRRSAGAVFDRIADLYDRARPSYPVFAVEDLVRSCELTGSSRIVEVGCGTGQLTAALADTGAMILAVEPGPALAALARGNLAGRPAVEVRTTRFEDLEATPGSFDLLVAATSFHWVDPTIGYHKAADLLRPGGRLALLTNAHTAGGNHTHPPFADAVRRLHHRLAPAIGDWTFPTAEEIAARAAGGGDMASLWARIDRNTTEPPDVSGRFEPPEVHCYPWVATYDRDAYLDMLASQSSYALMEPDQRQALLEGIGPLVDDLLGGWVTKQYVTVLATAQAR